MIKILNVNSSDSKVEGSFIDDRFLAPIHFKGELSPTKSFLDFIPESKFDRNELEKLDREYHIKLYTLIYDTAN